MASTTFTPNSTIASVEAEDQASGTTDLHSPLTDASDSTYTHTQQNAVNAYVELGLTDLPTDAVSTNPVTALSYTFRTRHSLTRNDDNITLLAQILDASDVALTNQVTVDVYNSGGATSFADQTGSFTIQGTPTESQWNGAKLRFDWTYAKTKSGDPVDIDIAEASIAVTYTQEAASDDLTADDLQSLSQLSTPSIGQIHAITADDLESSSELSTPALGQEHTLLADDLESTGELSTPAITESSALLADDLESASELSTPSIAQIHAITADNVESSSELSTPNITQEHGLLADDLNSASELSSPELTSVAGTDNLTADDLQSLSQLSTPDIAQIHAITADDLEAVSELSTPDLGQEHGLLADDLQSLSQLSQPALADFSNLDNLTADDLQSASELSTPDLFSAQADALLADDLEADPELSIPVLAQIHNLLADNVQSYSQLSRPYVDDGTEQPTTGGGVRRRDRRKIVVELPDGAIVEVDSREEAERLLSQWYDQHGEKKRPTLVKKKFKIKPYGQLPGEPDLPKEEVTLYRPPSRRAPVSDERIHDAIVAQSINEAIEVARKRRIERQKRDEEEIVILMSML